MEGEEFSQGTDQESNDLYEHFHFTVDRGQGPLRIDKYLIGRIERISRSRIQNAARAGCILVNQNPVKSNYKVRPADEVSVVLPHPVPSGIVTPEEIPLEIVYEDDSLVVIDKPAGMVVHPGVGNWTGTLVNGLIWHLGTESASGLPGDPERPGLVHRIDKDTSGLIVIGKTGYALSFLARQFFERTVERTYLALVWGDIKDEKGTIDLPVGRSLRYRQKMDAFPEGDHGKNAVTHYRVVERFHYVTLVECRLETGRTHQIRVHFSHTGHPLFSDPVYGGSRIVKGTVYSKYKQFVEKCFGILNRQALHAATLGFIHPVTEEKLFFRSELPPDFAEVVPLWREYANTLKRQS